MAEEEVLWHDVMVDVGWGKLRGKTCLVGNSDVKNGTKIVGVHGWLDNANSFDTLVPLLPLGVEVLVLDLPGHGLSDHLPLGAHYDVFAYLYNLRTAVAKLGWEKFILIGHSLGGAVSTYFTALYPEFVIAVICLDFVRPITVGSIVDKLRDYAANLLKAEENDQKHPVVYDEQEAIDRLVAARVFLEKDNPAIDQDAAYILLPRSARQVEGGYVWNHDAKARSNFLAIFGGSNWLQAVTAVKCPVLIVRATKGVCLIPDRYVESTLTNYRSNSEFFDVTTVEGSHHVHLTHPERIAPIVSAFIQKVISGSQKQMYSKL